MRSQKPKAKSQKPKAKSFSNWTLSYLINGLAGSIVWTVFLEALIFRFVLEPVTMIFSLVRSKLGEVLWMLAKGEVNSSEAFKCLLGKPQRT